MWQTVFRHQDIAKLSHDFVAVVAHSNPDHGEGEFIVGSKVQHSCKIYDLPTCKSHEDMRNALSQRDLLKGVRGTPTHIIYNPHDLTEISRSNYQSVSDIEDAMAGAQKVLGKPITWKEFSKLQKSLDDAEEALAEEKFRNAFKALKGFDAKGMTGLVTRSEALIEKIMAAGQAKLDEGSKLLEEGEAGKALKIFRNVARDFKGTDLEDVAKDLIAKAKAE